MPVTVINDMSNEQFQKIRKQQKEQKIVFATVSNLMKKFGFHPVNSHNNIFVSIFVNDHDVELTCNAAEDYILVNRMIKKSDNMVLTENDIKAEMVLNDYVKRYAGHGSIKVD